MPYADPEVDITLNANAEEGKPGETVTVKRSRAKLLVRGGAAHYATKGAARTAGGDPDSPAQTATATADSGPAKKASK